MGATPITQTFDLRQEVVRLRTEVAFWRMAARSAVEEQERLEAECARLAEMLSASEAGVR